MPLRSLLWVTPWPLLAVLAAVSMVMERFLRDVTFQIGVSVVQPYVVTANELVALLYALCAVVLVAPTMPEIDLRRPRSQWFAVGRYVVAILLVGVVSAFASHQVRIAYFIMVGRTQGSSPESELIINNSLLMVALAGITTIWLGSMRGTAAAVGCWLVANTPLTFTNNVTMWPFAVLQDSGPWFSWPHVLTTSVVLALSCLLQYRTAGATAKAWREEP